MNVVLLLEEAMAVPVPDAFAHRVGAVKELHETHARLDQPTGQDAVAGEAGFELVLGIVSAVERPASSATRSTDR